MQDKELTVENTSVGLVGVVEEEGKKTVQPFKLYDEVEVKQWLDTVGESQGGGGEGEGEGMDVDS